MQGELVAAAQPAGLDVLRLARGSHATDKGLSISSPTPKLDGALCIAPVSSLPSFHNLQGKA